MLTINCMLCLLLTVWRFTVEPRSSKTILESWISGLKSYHLRFFPPVFHGLIVLNIQLPSKTAKLSSKMRNDVQKSWSNWVCIVFLPVFISFISINQSFCLYPYACGVARASIYLSIFFNNFYIIISLNIMPDRPNDTMDRLGHGRIAHQ